ncbi:MAG: hypothetical protein NXH85_17260 [Pseudomonadaceae bacterium]|nr:hypothetical protein [Pseudomonadaceae bacterium]
MLWLFLGIGALLFYAGLMEARVIGNDAGAGPVSAVLVWFYLGLAALSFLAMVSYCRVTPVSVHLDGDQLLVHFLLPIGVAAARFDSARLVAIRELSVPVEYGYSPTMYRLVLRSRWLPILLDERADLMHLAPIETLVRQNDESDSL